MRSLCRFEGVTGEFSKHDFGEAWEVFHSGGACRVQFFASRLKHSRNGLVMLVQALAEHFQGIGGVPVLAVLDRLRRNVTKSDPKAGAVPERNRLLADVLADRHEEVNERWPSRDVCRERCCGPRKRPGCARSSCAPRISTCPIPRASAGLAW